MSLRAETKSPMDIFYKNNVVASVTFDENGLLEPLDFPSKRGLKKAKQYTDSCFVRDVGAHETLTVQLVGGEWQLSKEAVAL